MESARPLRPALLPLALAATLALTGAAAAASSKCKTKDMKGTWAGKLSGDVSALCMVAFNGSAKVSDASCFETDGLTALAGLKGRLKVSKSCEVSGTLTLLPAKGDKVEVSLNGTLDPKTNRVSGEVVDGDETFPLLLVRQWK